MARDYVAAFFPGNPIRFAQDYYEHYPKVALGHYPPLLYIAGAAWMLCFSGGRISMLIFEGAVAVGLALTLWRSARPVLGSSFAWAAACLLVLNPLVQEHYQMVMADLLVAWLALAALHYWIRYLQEEHWVPAFWFGVLAALSILTKTSGLWLAPLPLCTIVLTGKWHLFQRTAFWMPAAIVAVLSAPWTIFSYHMMAAGMAHTQGGVYASSAVAYFGKEAGHMLGGALGVLALIGYGERVILPLVRRQQICAFWATMFSLPALVFGFHLAVPVGLEERYLLPALPALLCAAMAGLKAAIHRLNVALGGFPPAEVPLRRTFVALTLAVVLPGAFAVHKQFSGFAVIAAEVCVRSPEERVLISSDAAGEGAFIAEVAERDRRPSHTVCRSSKLLASSDWMGGDYVPAFHTEESLLAGLRKADVRLIAVENFIPAGTRAYHHELLARTLAHHPAEWRLLRVEPVLRPGVAPGQDSVALYVQNDVHQLTTWTRAGN